MNKKIVLSLTLFLLLFSQTSQADSPINSLLLKKANEGDNCAQAKIGHDFSRGKRGLRKDYPKSIEWHEKAASAECTHRQCKECKSSAMRSLAILYKNKIIPIDEKKAFYWFHKAAENNNRLAFKSVAEYFAEGKHVKQDYEKAYFWITRGRGKNVSSSYDDFIEEIKSHLTSEQIKRIDEQNNKFIQELMQNQRNAYADMMDKINLGFNPNAPIEQKALSRLSFELGINEHHYDLTGVKKLIAMGALEAESENIYFMGGTKHYSSILFQAQKLNDLALVKLLIENGANINSIDARGFTVLHRAIGHNHTEIALELIKAGADLSVVSLELNNTPLMAAARRGYLTIVTALVEAGADINQRVENAYNKTAIQQALRSKRYNVARYLQKKWEETRPEDEKNPPPAPESESKCANTKECLDEALMKKAIDAGRNKLAKHLQKKLKKTNQNKPRTIPSDDPRCAAEGKTCPDNTLIKKGGNLCEFPACPEPKRYEPVEKVSGTFSEIDTELSYKAIFVLNNGTKEEKDKVIENIKNAPENYNPAALKTMSRTLFSRIEDEDAAFWYIAADLRKRHDVLICEDDTSKKKLASYYSMVHQFKPFAQLNVDLMKSIYEKVLQWDRTTPYNYDVRWANIHNKSPSNKPVDPLPQNLCIPEERKGQAREFSRQEYDDIFNRYIQSFDYRAKPKYFSSTRPTIEDFKLLLSRAKTGDAEAQYRLASVTMTREYKEIIQEENTDDFRERWLTAASNQGHLEAMSRLGANYISGLKIPEDQKTAKFEQGKKILIKAGQRGAFRGYLSIAEHYLRNDDQIEAYAWYVLAESVVNNEDLTPTHSLGKKKRRKLEIKMPDDELKIAKERAQEYLEKYLPQ